MNRRGLFGLLRSVFVGRARDLTDDKLFHKVSLIALLAWVGLGADGLSSSCYGPEESFKMLGEHTALVPFIALACMITIAVICASYSQIIELFPGGGGGYLVASKLLSPSAGVVAGCALLVDYVLTIAISIASGADALFSILPPEWRAWKLPFAITGILFLTVLNLRGVRESVILWVPVFTVFLLTHAYGILIAFFSHLPELPSIARATAGDVVASHSQLGWMGLFMLLVRGYSVGAGTYTGIEAVSNGLPILREPRAETGKRTMLYMGVSLALTVGGLLLAYLLYSVTPQEGKTLNAVLFEKLTAGWSPGLGRSFVFVAMLSATALLFVAAQAGFLDGPRVMSNMALDRWFPTRFAMLSDRFVTQNGIILMGAAAAIVLLATQGMVRLMVVLYSINVFITFTLSQLGMIRHWWMTRRGENKKLWKRKISVNGVGFCLTTFILVMLTLTKFWEGGWITLFVTGVFVGIAFLTRRHYRLAASGLARLDTLVPALTEEIIGKAAEPDAAATTCNPSARTAVVLVSGFNGLGIHTLLKVQYMFPGVFKNYVFLQVGVVDAGNFKGAGEIENLRDHIAAEAEKYVEQMRRRGFYAEAVTDIGIDVVETVDELSKTIMKRFPHSVFFAGQLVFAKDSRFSRLLHNFVVFALQQRFVRHGSPFLIVPIRV